MNRRLVFMVMGFVCLIGAAVCGAYIYLHTAYAPPAVSETLPTVAPVVTLQMPATATPEATEVPATSTVEPTATPEPYDCPIDFDGLQDINSDIYAWVVVENTNVDYPVLQHPSNDNYYLNHNSDGSYSAYGAIYTQSTYNSLLFDDPITVMYGHRLEHGGMFGSLMQYFSDDDFFEENRNIVVYTPDAKFEYKIFAAVPFSNEHLLYGHDFTDEEEFDAFIDRIYAVDRWEANLDPDSRPEFGDKLLVLSTCLKSDHNMRFLVLGALQP